MVKMDIDTLFSCFDEETVIKNKVIQDSNENSRKRKIETEVENTAKKKKDDLPETTSYHQLSVSDQCIHKVAIPFRQKVPLLKDNPTKAREYKFKLDPFQEKAVQCIDNSQSVLVSAHTSAGKTVVAEYAIALSLKNKQRVIYTTPIKALSNQKYRELLEEFKDVGLMTGDTTINPSASCLIMTTEILRSMLFKGSEITKEVGWVIFDEIHYMRDATRGVVWEETIVMLSDHVRYVFLSATIPNARQFAEWIAELHKQPCHVIYTEKRPTPLQHYLFPIASKGMHLIINENNEFQPNNFNNAMSSFQVEGDDSTSKKVKIVKKDNVFNVVNVMMDLNLAPLIIFSFSKRECEEYAVYLARLDFNSSVEKKLVTEVFQNAINLLSDEDKEIRQIHQVLPLLQRGIAYHHSGLLPIIKETVEILFGEGLIKALFATETFAMGLNMPAKSVVFTSVKKFDGVGERYITSGEYIQMSGRAGRRGIDDKGTVVLMINEACSPDIIQNIMLGKADPLNSAFHLTYHMILNLLRQEDVNPEYMIEKSFLIFQTKNKIKNLNKALKKKKTQYINFTFPNEKLIQQYEKIKPMSEELHDEIRKVITTYKYIKPFFNEGRVLKIKNNKINEWGVLINGSLKNWEDRFKKSYYSILIPYNDEFKDNYKSIHKGAHIYWEKKKYSIIELPICHKDVYQICDLTLSFNSLTKVIAMRHICNKIKNLKKEHPIGLPLLHPVDDMKIKDSRIVTAAKQIYNLEKKMLKVFEKLSKEDISKCLTSHKLKSQILNEITDIESEISKEKSLLYMEDLQKRKNILRKLDYCTESDVITMKGRIACELHGSDELLLTEAMFNGLFNELTAEDCVALLSCFINDEKDEGPPAENSKIREIVLSIKEIQKRIKNITSQENLLIDNKKYEKSLNESLVNMFVSWCRGAHFKDIMTSSPIHEGSVVRYFRMLAEVLEQMCKAVRNIGNTDLENRFSRGIQLLKRNIPFAGSLYL